MKTFGNFVPTVIRGHEGKVAGGREFALIFNSLVAKKMNLIEDNLYLNELLGLINFTIPNETRLIQIRNILGFNQYFFHRKLKEAFSRYSFSFFLFYTIR